MMKSTLFSMLSVAAFAMLLAGCKDTPADVARKWHKATFIQADASKAVEFVTNEDKDKTGDLKDSTKEFVKTVKSWNSESFGEPKTDGDMTKVIVSYKDSKDEKQKIDYELEKENGTWKISKVKVHEEEKKKE